ncbi:hypothetical protein ASG88_04515 [Nocardioides sp. Soil777]|nr:hypothetical protein ASG88_04515 [Nocardioides sp. Soil777]
MTDGGRSAVYVDGQVIVLSEMATFILDTVPDGVAVHIDGIESSVVAEFGPPPPPGDAKMLTRGQVIDLLAHGVLIDDAPTVATAPTVRSTESLYAALAHLRSTHQSRWHLPNDVSPAEFLASARQHHVLPFLAHHSHRLDLPTDLDAAMTAASTRVNASVRVLVGELAHALEALTRADVRALVFKGLALATQAYGHASVRGAGDLDLLVSPQDLVAAHEALVRAGWRHDPTYPRPAPSWAWRHMVRTGYELTLESDVSILDLHWHLSPMKSTSPSFDDLWRRREVLDIGGRQVPTLSRYDALAHSAAHSAKDQWRWLRSLLDVHLLASDARTWQPNRRLRHDELVTLGLAVLALGRPETAPTVVDQAALAALPHRERVIALHVGTEQSHVPPETPGTTLARSLRAIWRSRSSVTEVPRVVSSSLLPTWLTVDEQAASAAAAVPRLLSRRARLMTRRVMRRDASTR